MYSVFYIALYENAFVSLLKNNYLFCLPIEQDNLKSLKSLKEEISL